MSYQVIEGGALIVRLADNAWIPANPENRDYQEFLRWQEAGGVAAAFEFPAAVNTVPPEAS